MNLHDGLVIFSRWLHLISACLLIGSTFFFQALLPLGTGGMEPEDAAAVFFRLRRGFKMTVHVTLLLFLLSGGFNAYQNWKDYSLNRPLLHGLFGMHLLLGLGAVTVLMVMLAGRTARKSSDKGLKIALLCLFLAVAVASTLKSAREFTVRRLGPPKWAPMPIFNADSMQHR